MAQVARDLADAATGFADGFRAPRRQSGPALYGALPGPAPRRGRTSLAPAVEEPEPQRLRGKVCSVDQARAPADIVPLGERRLSAVMHEFVEHYHAERNHQGLGNVIPFPSRDSASPVGRIRPTRKARWRPLLLRAKRRVSPARSTIGTLRGLHVLPSSRADDAKPEDGRDVARQGRAARGRQEVRRQRASVQPPGGPRHEGLWPMESRAHATMSRPPRPGFRDRRRPSTRTTSRLSTSSARASGRPSPSRRAWRNRNTPAPASGRSGCPGRRPARCSSASTTCCRWQSERLLPPVDGLRDAAPQRR